MFAQVASNELGGRKGREKRAVEYKEGIESKGERVHWSQESNNKRQRRARLLEGVSEPPCQRETRQQWRILVAIKGQLSTS